MIPPANPHYANPPGFGTLVIFGAGGFGREVAWLARQSWGHDVELVFVVDRPEYLEGQINGIPVRLLSDIEPSPDMRYVVALGSPAQRLTAAKACEDAGLAAGFLIHPRAEASEWISFGAGTIVCAGTIATANIRVGAHVHVNLDCTIGHDVSIGEFTTLAPGVHVSGNVHIGREVYVGTGATVINGSSSVPLVIGDRSVIAAGACVIAATEPGSLVAGVPAVRKG